MSGNKYLLLLCVAVMSLASCDLFKHSRRDDNVIILQPNKNDTSTTQIKNDTAATNTTASENNGSKKSWAKKPSYNVAFILPFDLDAIELSTLMGDDKISSYQPLASVEFYEGALLALDSLKAMGADVHVFVFDNVKDSAATAILFQEPEMKTMDLMIGPVFNQSLKLAADFAKKNEIFLISPLSPSSSITEDNRYYIMANATLKTQLQKTIEYFYKSDPQANIILVYRKDKEAENKMAKEFLGCFNSYKTTNKIYQTVTEVTTAAEAGDAIKTGVHNYIFIASTDELFVNGLVRSLSVKSRGSDNINIVGMPALMDMESLSVDYFENLHYHYPTAYWADPNAPSTERFLNSFESKYASYPSEYAFRGYDLTSYFCQLLYQYGPDISTNLNKYLPLRSPLYRFQFSAATNENNMLRFYENTNIVILKYDNYRFEKVN